MARQKKKAFVEKLESSSYMKTLIAQSHRAQLWQRNSQHTHTFSQQINVVNCVGDTCFRKLL